MKQYGLLGKGTGKLGSSVFAISGGEQIVREYNPKVSNPNTSLQVEQRAKFKLLSQLAAALAPAIVIAKKGLTSARNRFVSINFGLTEYANSGASVAITNLQLSEGSQLLGATIQTTTDENVLKASLAGDVAEDITHVAYVLAEQTDDDKLALKKVVVVAKATSATFEATIGEYSSGEYVIYAYGIKSTGASSNVMYEDYISAPAVDSATVITSSVLRAAGNIYTKTIGNLISI